MEECSLVNKVCALLDRNALANRDIFDLWFFMQGQTLINTKLVEERMQISYADYIQKYIDKLDSFRDRGMLQGLDELMDPEIKIFVKTKLREEVTSLLRFCKEFPG